MYTKFLSVKHDEKEGFNIGTALLAFPKIEAFVRTY